MKNLVSVESINIEDIEIDLVDKFVYLCDEIRISRDNRTCELQKRIKLGWAVYGKVNHIFKSDIPKCQKIKVFYQRILSVLKYGVKILTFTTTNARSLKISKSPSVKWKGQCLD